MKRTTQSPVSIGAEEIITSNLYIDGIEIGTAMLPKLVHRTSLSPIVVDGQIEQRQFYTLHNDAGDCVFVSPALQDRMNKKWKRPWRWNWRTAESWHLHPILVPEGSHGGFGALIPDDDGISLPDGSIETEKEIITDISWWYATNKRKTVIPPSYEGYKAKNILKANHTWEKSGLKSYNMNLPICEEGTRMFAESYDLASFTATDFKSLVHAEGMFEKCSLITTPPTTKDMFSSVQYGSKMYKETGLTEFDLDMPNLENAVEMFYYCDKLASFTANVPNLKKMDSMFDTCFSLDTFYVSEEAEETEQSTELKFNSVETATYAFYSCEKLGKFDCKEMRNLTDASFMFYGCPKLKKIETLFDSLTIGKGMFQNCSSLTTFRTGNEIQFPSLTDGKQMFANCRALQTFKLNTPNLQNGTNMFRNCSALTSITDVNLQSLNIALAMFGGGVRLDRASCLLLGSALRANTGTWASIVDGQRNGIVVGVDASLRSDESVREALGLANTPEEPVEGLGANEEAGEITNSIQSKILTRVSWN